MSDEKSSFTTEEQIAIAGGFVQVKYENFSMPFSKGILARSLTSIGLKRQQSYFVSQTIEKILFEKKILTITNQELVTVTYNVLHDHFPEEVGDNYLLLHQLHEQKVPLVIMLGGATAVGKSTVASNLAYRYGIRHVFGTDIVREAMRSVITSDIIPELHESSYSAWKRMAPWKQARQDKVLLGFEEQAQHVIAGIEGIVERSLNEGISIIVEGVHICPQLMNPDLLERQNVIPVLLRLNEKEAHLSRIFARSESVVVKRPATKYIEYFDEIRKIQDHLTTLALQANIPVIENTNQAETVMKIIAIVMKRIKKLVEGNNDS